MPRKPLMLILLLIFTFFLPRDYAIASSEFEPGGEPYSGLPICQPEFYADQTSECLPLGPSEVLSNLAAEGIEYPAPPLPASHPDKSLTELTINLAKINLPITENAYIYGSLDGAINGGESGKPLQAGEIVYVSFSEQVSVNGNAYVSPKSGGWMRASPISGYSQFQGLTFSETPQQDFGWIISPTRPRSSPDYQAEELDYEIPRETVVQIYDIEEVNGTKWFMVDLNRWVDDINIAQLIVNQTPPEGVPGDRWIELNLHEQTIAVYENRELVFASLIASGVDPYFTRPGLFQIYEKKPLETMSGAFAADRSDYYHLEDVPWTLYFDEARALHGAYWRAMFGYEQSHGCVNMSVGDSRWVYDWADVGDWVYVWDPSGRTPTDPGFYGAGGASHKRSCIGLDP